MINTASLTEMSTEYIDYYVKIISKISAYYFPPKVEQQNYGFTV